MKTNYLRSFVAKSNRDLTMDTGHCESHHNAAQHEKKAVKRAHNQKVRRTAENVIQEQLNDHS